MAQSFDDADFWLPGKPLPHHDSCMGRDMFGLNANGFLVVNQRCSESGLDNEFAQSLSNFPNEFPYEIDSPVESVLSSTETKSSDEEDLAGLARALTQSPLYESPSQKLPVPGFVRHKPEKSWVMAGSPKSTLSGNRQLVESQPALRKRKPEELLSDSISNRALRAESETWDLVYAAAMKVARLKMTCQEAEYSAHQQNRGLVSGRITNSGLH